MSIKHLYDLRGGKSGPLRCIFSQVGIDFMTDLPPSEGFDSIMVTVDHGLSKGVILTPCSKTGLTAEHMA